MSHHETNFPRAEFVLSQFIDEAGVPFGEPWFSVRVETEGYYEDIPSAFDELPKLIGYIESVGGIINYIDAESQDADFLGDLKELATSGVTLSYRGQEVSMDLWRPAIGNTDAEQVCPQCDADVVNNECVNCGWTPEDEE